MTISTTTIKNSYSGNGSTTTFNYTFKITDQDDIDVIIRSSSGTETTKTITTHYTVTGVGNSSGGTIVFTSGNIPASGETVLLRRSTPSLLPSSSLLLANQNVNTNANENVNRNANTHFNRNVSREPNFRYTTILLKEMKENDKKMSTENPILGTQRYF